MATIYEVSKAAGVSLATVSRVMNGNVRVSERTRDKVLKAMTELGYKPNAIAQSLASNCSNSVGLLVSALHGSFFGDMMSTVENVLRKAGKHVVITAGHSDEEKEKQAIEFLLDRRCDALILHAEAVSDEYLLELAKGDAQIILINRKIDAISERCFYTDNELGGYLATKAALDAGHKDIAYISGPLFKGDAKERLAGHQRALAEANITLNDALLVEGGYHEAEGAQGLEQLYRAKHRFSALICANDEMASGAMTAARELGIAIPEQLSIIGFDNVLFARYLYPKLTTIDNPIRLMGEAAAHWVLAHVYQQRGVAEPRNLFAPSLVARDSLVNAP
ncbi:LacI family DNA-binding transcriptional regulator [Pseudoalteromonas ruthenica]|uniref:LacI family DNA-binding transcriptional regulator n=1 Tax=Pseudoalteromonas ruthenica TaxID=151081 RepID=UPI00110BC313|nr:LacI family DNA-binding transcriptional regulator [Pseudoalteromonas ruthenica]TMO48350.1 LacI family transcriptional regulator [Pseudoalteromonas ruthenica]TMO48764.1 LacI family transcriptional regulator [Pseudoalteromonas ruthenica]